MTKHDIKKQEIINTAFSEWGKSCFYNTSLVNLSSKLNISKTALYRYFPSKEYLLNSMADQFLDELGALIGKIDDYKNNDFFDFLKFYISEYYDFISERPYFIHFFSLFMRKDSFIKNVKFKSNQTNEMDIIFKQLIKSDYKISKDQVISFISYILCTLFFVLSVNKKNRIDETIKKSETIKIVVSIIRDGFKTDKTKKMIDYENIEKLSMIKSDEIIERDKIFDAITSVVASEGIWNASLEKIAKFAGITKSAFYFHFKNKDEMFSNMFYNEINTIKDLFFIRQNYFSDFEDKLYCNTVVDFSYFTSDIRIAHFFDWLQFQKVNIKFFHENNQIISAYFKERFEFLARAMEDGRINSYKLDLEQISGLLNMQVGKEIFAKLMEGKTPEVNDLRFVFNLFLYGLR